MEEESKPVAEGAVVAGTKADFQQLNKEVKILDKTAELRAKIAAQAKSNLAAPKPVVASARILTPEELNANVLSIPSLLETEDNEYEHAVIYGAPKTGKTLSICLLSEFYHILFLDGDKGLKTAIRTLPTEMQARIHPIRIPDNTSNPVFWNSILKLITGRQVTICVGHGIVDCPICKQSQAQLATIALNKLPKNWVVAMDSITQFVASAMASINRKATNGKDTNDEFKFTFDEWGVLRNMTEKFGNYLKDLECNFLAVSHDMLVKTEDEKTSKIVPIGGTENASRAFAKYFSTAVNCRILNKKHVFVTSSTDNANIQTGSRSNVRLETAETPSLLHLFRADAAELLKGSWNEWFYSDQKKPQPKPKGVLPE
jgi:hypothetical protein